MKTKTVKTPEEFGERAEEYFKACEAAGKPPTVSGLARSLGFKSRQSFHDYATKESHKEFHDVAGWVSLMIDEFWEGRLNGTSPAGAIFWLCNRGEDGAAKFKQTQHVNSTLDATHRISKVEIELVHAQSANTGEA